MKKTTGDCDESCECHDDKIVVGDRVNFSLICNGININPISYIKNSTLSAYFTLPTDVKCIIVHSQGRSSRTC